MSHTNDTPAASETLTDDMIRDLRAEARVAGDLVTVHVCHVALGDETPVTTADAFEERYGGGGFSLAERAVIMAIASEGDARENAAECIDDARAAACEPGEQGLRSVEYRDADDDSLVWVATEGAGEVEDGMTTPTKDDEMLEALLADVDALSDEELLSEVRESGRDPSRLASDVRRVIDGAVTAFQSERRVKLGGS